MDWTEKEMPLLSGRRFLVTGGNSGIGYQAAVGLARRGGLVVLACRDRVRGEAALARLRREATGPESAAGAAEMVELNLASLESVRRVAEFELARGNGLHCLINNAGVMGPKKRLETKEGFELQFGTNVLGHYALTGLLMPALEQAADEGQGVSRVVTIASIAHKRGKINFDDLDSTRSYDPMGAYSQSKLADLMFSFELERRLRAAGAKVMSVAAHPGVANTRLFQGEELPTIERTIRKLSGYVIQTVLGSDKDGALPTLYAATADSAEGGGYYGPQGMMEMRGGDVGPAKVTERARDEQVQRRLWEVCAEMTGVQIKIRPSLAAKTG